MVNYCRFFYIGGNDVWKFYGLAAFVIALDQWTKWLVVKNMKLGERIPIFETLFCTTFTSKSWSGMGNATRSNGFFYNRNDYCNNRDYLLFS